MAFHNVVAFASGFGELEMAVPGVLGSWGEWLFIFWELESTSNYFQGAGEHALNFRELGSTVRM